MADIRRATTLADIRAAQQLFDRDVSVAAAERFLTESGHHLLLAYDDGKPVGFVSGVEMTHPDKGTEMFLYELGVLPDYQRRGHGRALVAALAAAAKRAGCYGMWVLTDDFNTAAMTTYQSAGANRSEATTMLTWDFDSR
jgi:ribosomal protein S18 acetylase RimI-like enzyme